MYKNNILKKWYEDATREKEGLPRYNEILNVARCIWKHYYEGEFDDHLLEAMKDCFKDYDPLKGNPSKTPQNRFLTFFSMVFKRKVQKFSVRNNKKTIKENHATIHYLTQKKYSSRTDTVYWQFAWEQYQNALASMPSLDRECIKMIYAEELSYAETGRRVNLDQRTIKNRYNLDSVKELIKQQIQLNLKNIPKDELRQQYETLSDEYGFSDDEILKLFGSSKAEMNVDMLLRVLFPRNMAA